MLSPAGPTIADRGFGAALRLALGTALAYAAVGAAALWLAGPPGYASPLYPSAGIALVAVLTYGRAAWPGVWLGAFAVNTTLGLLHGQSGIGLVLLPMLIGLGATLQAGVGAALMRRFVGPGMVLNAPRDIALAGLLGGLLATLISPSLATPALVATGALPASEAPITWLTWWIGDSLGVLIAAPLVLTLIGQPAADWRARRRTLGLPLLLAMILVFLSLLETERLNRARQQAIQERDVDRLAAEVRSRLDGALHALQALAGAAQAQGGLDRSSLRAASNWWLGQPFHLQAIGYSVRVRNEQVAAFEAQARVEDGSRYRVFDRDDGRARALSGEVVAIRHIEPAAGNAAALGVNALSIPAAREAIAATRRNGEPAATAAFRLTQSQAEETGVVLYQALYLGKPADEAAREADFRGVVFVTLRTEQALSDLGPAGASFTKWCLLDNHGVDGGRRLGGPAGCETHAASPAPVNLERAIVWGGRVLMLRAWADPRQAGGGQRETAWLLALSGLAAAAMLGALLLTVTGHQRRTELAVRTRTEELHRQVADRQQAEAELRESGQRLRSILDNVPLGVLFLDPQGHLIECNPTFCEMVGRSPAELLGRSVVELVRSGDAAGIRRMRRELLQGHARARVESMGLRGDAGRDLTVRVSVSALRDADGELLRMVGVVEDITERLRLDASESALHRAEEANRAKSEFLSRMSHELRTPLNAMIGFAQLLALDNEPALVARQRDWTQHIQRAGWHLLDMINETLDLARIDAGATPLQLVAVDLATMVAACRAMVAGQAAPHGVLISEQLSPHAPAVLGDPTRVKQVLTNLLSNAVKYNRVGGSVVVSSRPGDAATVEIAVTDSGLGMTEAQVAALFQPYNRLGRENSGIEGTGIGLVISRRLTELMGGSLTVASQAGSGSTFTITLPAAPAAERTPAPYTDTSPAPYQQRLVHYVEDNETNIEVMRGVLAQRAQIRLETSMLGLDGLAAIRRGRPDLILLDMQLPDISGLELLRHLKQDDEMAAIPVIVVSADATPANRERALTLGAQHYVTKPLDVAAFLLLVDSALEAADTRWGL